MNALLRVFIMFVIYGAECSGEGNSEEHIISVCLALYSTYFSKGLRFS